MTDRYAPKSGDKLYAKDIQSVMPLIGTAGKLVGGNNPSAVSIFESLRTSGNAGKLKINIDGNIFDDVIVLPAFSLLNFSYANKMFTTLSGVGNMGLYFKSDGTKVYYFDQSAGCSVFQRTLSTPWDITTAGGATSKYFTSLSNGGGFTMSPDGVNLYTVWRNSGANDILMRAVMSTPWDITTAGSPLYDLTFGSVVSAGGITFKPDGTKMYVWFSGTMRQYTLSTPWNTATATADGKTFATAGDNLTFYNNGLNCLGGDGKAWNLGTAWDISTMVYSGSSFSLASGGGGRCYVSSDFSRFFTMSGQNCYQYNNGTALTSLTDVATLLQTAIRNITGKTEAIIYNTNHFEIYSSRVGSTSKILKLMTPSSGTDLSGSSSPLYLDCASNAVETLGTGINPQVEGRLIGGSSVSVVSVFEALRAGSNNGKIKTSIDGVTYDNVAVDLDNSPSTSTTETEPVNYGNTTIAGETGINSDNAQYVAQVFDSGNLTTITAIEAMVYNQTGNTVQPVCEIRLGDGVSGTLIGSKTMASFGTSGTFLTKVSFDTTLIISKNTIYTIVWKMYRAGGATGWGIKYSTNTSLGYYPNSTTKDTTKRLCYNIYTKSKVVSSFSDIATCLQLAIRAVTGKTEIVNYTDRLSIVSSITNTFSQVLKFTSPSIGTDISGAGATPYLDCASKAVEVLGVGEDDKIIRLDNTGKVSPLLLKLIPVVSANERDINDTQVTSTGVTAVKVKEFKFNGLAGTIRAKFQLSLMSGTANAFGAVFKNGTIISAYTSMGNNGWLDVSNDFSVANGDLIQVYVYGTASNSVAGVKNFRLCYDALPSPVSASVNL